MTLPTILIVAAQSRRQARQPAGVAHRAKLLRPGEAIPEAALRFVADQLGTDSEVPAAYAAPYQTRYEQLDALRETSSRT